MLVSKELLEGAVFDYHEPFRILCSYLSSNLEDDLNKFIKKNPNYNVIKSLEKDEYIYTYLERACSEEEYRELVVNKKLNLSTFG